MNILKIKLITLVSTLILFSVIAYAQTPICERVSDCLTIDATNTGGGLNIFTDTGNSHFSYWANGNTILTGNEIVLRTSDNTHRLRIKDDGKVGIGTDSPLAKLDVNGWGRLKGILVGNVWALSPNGDDLSNSYRLFVEKGILTEKVKCAIKTTGDWSDYVFEEDYEMMDINDLEGFVTENKHLPNVPSAEEMVANGLDVAKMDAKLLEKIEEAYLYIIDMNKEMKTMNEKVDALANENGELKASLSAISTSGK